MEEFNIKLTESDLNRLNADGEHLNDQVRHVNNNYQFEVGKNIINKASLQYNCMLIALIHYFLNYNFLHGTHKSENKGGKFYFQ